MLRPQQSDVQIEGIQIVRAERGDQYPAQLLIIRRYLQFGTSASDSEVVDHDLTLLERALGYSSNFTELQISEMLNTQPDSRTKNREHKAERTSGGPEQKQAEQSKQRRHCIQHDHYLPMRKSQLQELVMDMFSIGRKDRMPSKKTA